MKAIQVKYLRATDTQGERMKASAVNWGSKIVDWDYAFDFDENAALAAEALIAKVYANDPEDLHPTISRYGSGNPECATLPNGDMVFVLNYHYQERWRLLAQNSTALARRLGLIPDNVIILGNREMLTQVMEPSSFSSDEEEDT
jgi:hypothetical protein